MASGFDSSFVNFLDWFVWRGLSSFVGFPKGQSVIEEKGEGFENGKKFVGSFGMPSTSDFPPNSSQDLRFYILINVVHHK